MNKIEIVDLFDVIEKEARGNGNGNYLKYDLKSDRKRLVEAAGSDDPEKKWLLYLTRENGTYMAYERNIWMAHSESFKIWTFYYDVPYEHPKAYLIHVTGRNNENVFGSIHPMNYRFLTERILIEAVPSLCRMKCSGGEYVWKNEEGRSPAMYSFEYGELVEMGEPQPQEEYEWRLENILKAERSLIIK